MKLGHGFYFLCLMLVGERKRHKSAPDDQKAAEVINQPLPPQQNNLTRKSSSSSLKDLSAAEASVRSSNFFYGGDISKHFPRSPW